MTNVSSAAAGPAATPHHNGRQAVMDGHARYVFPCVRPYYEDPIVAADGKGAVLRDADGTEYLDFFSGILTTSLGHCNEEVNAAVKAQLDQLGHTSSLYLTEPQVKAARLLASITPPGVDRALFTNSGSEAIETAIIAAQLHTGRQEVIALRHSYHGRSILATNLTGSGPWRPLDTAISWIKHARAPYLYRSLEGRLSEDEAGERFAADLEEVIATSTSGRPAAFIAETILGVGGYLVPPRTYFARAAEVIRSHGGLFIADEVQAGFGRTGTWFGIEQWGVTPDIMVLAKGIANGIPAAATMAREEIAQSWTAKTISTYGGNPVSMAALAATLEVMIREDVPGRATARGAQLRQGLDALAADVSWIGEVRGLGLMQALELVEDKETREPSPEKAHALLEAAKDERLLIGRAGVHNNVIRIAPHLLISEAEVADALQRLEAAIHRAVG